MSLSHAQLQAVIEEVAALAVPSSVQRAYARDAQAVVLQLRGGGETRYLLLDPTAGSTRMHFVDAKPQQPQHPPNFVMLLRKRLVGAVLRDVQLADHDRVVNLVFDKRTEDGVTTLTLVAKLFGRSGKITLEDEGAAEEPPAGEERSHRSNADPLGLAALPLGARSSAVSTWYDARLAHDEQDRGRRELAAALRSEIKRARRLVRNLQKDLDRVDAAAEYRRFGELLQSAYSLEVPRGAESVNVPDYYADGAPEVAVPLDPARSLKQNIARYFHEYRRMSGAGDQILERMLAAEGRVEQLEVARAELETTDGADQITELHARLTSEGLLRRKAQQRRQAKKETLPYRVFLARSGAQIFVGRGAKNNDILTKKVARGRDVWLHARDWAGAHVILRMDSDTEPRGEDLRDAALLAAHFSKGKNDTVVEITHTRAKWVNKPKGAPPGLVTVGGGSTIAVRPAEDRLAELIASEVFDD
jgi:predicted ribosome quality control (RQC) complex YloA/Tae2 family protein